MECVEANIDNVNIIKNIAQTTIKEIYSRYYPVEIVDFFIRYNSFDNIVKSLRTEIIYMLKDFDTVIGIGSVYKNEIRRMFILPKYQNQGFGSELLDFLENKVFENGYTNVVLDSSLSAYLMYVKKGYATIKYDEYVTHSGHVLCCNKMEKNLVSNKNLFDYQNYKSTINNIETFYSIKIEGKIIKGSYKDKNINGQFIGSVEDKVFVGSYQEIDLYGNIVNGQLKIQQSDMDTNLLLKKYVNHNLIEIKLFKTNNLISK